MLYWIFIAVWTCSLVVASGGHSLAAMCRLLTVTASRVAEHGPWGVRSSVTAARGLSSFGSQALEHRLSSCAQA